MRRAWVLLLIGALAACSTPTKPVSEVNPDSHAGHRTFSAAPPAPLRDGERFLELAMPRPFTPVASNGATDEYRCFLIDPKITDRAYITGSQFLPQNADLVHHAIFFRVTPSDVPQATKMDSDAGGDGWTCFGGTGIDSDARGRAGGGAASWIAAWAPGGDEVVLGSKTGYEMQPGSRIIMQIHYNLLAAKGKPAGADQSGIRLRLMNDTPGIKALQTTLLPAPVELPCTAQESGPLCERKLAVINVQERFGNQAGFTVTGLNLLCNKGIPVPGPTQTCDTRVREAGTIHAVAGHMHLLGRSIKVELNPGTDKAKVLLDVPIYNFDDQGARALPEPIKVNKGDTLRVTCTHDAELRKMLPALKDVEPRYVVWGEGTSDEMCLGIVTWTK